MWTYKPRFSASCFELYLSAVIFICRINSTLRLGFGDVEQFAEVFIGRCLEGNGLDLKIRGGGANVGEVIVAADI